MNEWVNGWRECVWEKGEEIDLFFFLPQSRDTEQPLWIGHYAGLQRSVAKDWKGRLVSYTWKDKMFGLDPVVRGRAKSFGKLNLIVSAGRGGGRVQEQREPYSTCSSRLIQRSSRHWTTDKETYRNKNDYCITHSPPIFSVLEVPPSPVFFVRPLATLELLSVWLELRCFRREEAGGWFLLHLCLPFHCRDNSR